jgi:beta-lactamase class D
LAITTNPSDRIALKERVKVEESLSKANFDLSEDIEVVLSMDEKAERGNVYRTHRKDEQRLITNCGKVYMLTIGQCTQALKDKLKEDSTWDKISASYDHWASRADQEVRLKADRELLSLSGSSREVEKHVELRPGRRHDLGDVLREV